jgi:hypothetical protein
MMDGQSSELRAIFVVGDLQRAPRSTKLKAPLQAGLFCQKSGKGVRP